MQECILILRKFSVNDEIYNYLLLMITSVIINKNKENDYNISNKEWSIYES